MDSESIRSYLESSYYNESDASVDEIKDISQEQGNNDKEFIVSCTVKASNRYAVQTANWVITFERFENSWVGTGREMTYYETELQNGMSEEEMKDLVDLEGLYWQKEFESWLTYDVSERVTEELYSGLRMARFDIAHTAQRQHIGSEIVVFSEHLDVDSIQLLRGANASWVSA